MAVFVAAPYRTLLCANDNEKITDFLLDIRGQTAALSGLPLAANPYSAGSLEAACWTAGWLAGALEMIGDRTPAQPLREWPRAVAMEPLAV